MGGITSGEYEMGIARLVERALALVAYGYSEERKLSGILARAEEVRQDDGWCIGGAWGDYGEVVVPLRILSYVIEGELDQKIASTDPGFALTYAEQVRRAEIAEAKRPEAREIPDAEVAAAYSAFVQASFGFPGAPAMRAALEASRDVSGARLPEE